ncbi:hypothetical protein AB832_04525 [Flavobacteriaceae bacterium (ex Bugula neritina AB1)]|nr:hypothetical protein AB832_04525 [Flavobacteriaceae bacterium (ex Bugula neritina AB1)]
MKPLDNILYKIFVILGIYCGAVGHTNAQENKKMNTNIAGVYNITQGHSPEGGQQLFVFEDHSYALAYFGGINVGSWYLEDNVVYFKSSQEPEFVVYSKQRKDRKKRKIIFRLNDKKRVFIDIDNNQKFQPIFNSNANCFGPNYSVDIKKSATSIRLGKAEAKTLKTSKDQNNIRVFEYKIPEEHNDIIIMNLSEEYSTSNEFKAVLKNKQLFLGEDSRGVSKKEFSSIKNEEVDYIKSYCKVSLFPEILEYGHEFFPIPNEEKHNPDDFIAFQKINITLNKDVFNFDKSEEPLFTANCDK